MSLAVSRDSIYSCRLLPAPILYRASEPRNRISLRPRCGNRHPVPRSRRRQGGCPRQQRVAHADSSRGSNATNENCEIERPKGTTTATTKKHSSVLSQARETVPKRRRQAFCENVVVARVQRNADAPAIASVKDTRDPPATSPQALAACCSFRNGLARSCLDCFAASREERVSREGI